MNWTLEPKEIIGVEIPFDRNLLGGVNLQAVAVFPDTVNGTTYVYPALCYQLYGGGVSEEVRVASTDATISGTVHLLPGTNRVRIYLSYNAKVGPLGTLPRGALMKSVLTVEVVVPNEMPLFGVKEFGLALKSNATRVTMPVGTTIDYPLHITTAEPVPVTTATMYKHFHTVDSVPKADMVFAIELTEPAEHELGYAVMSYMPTPVMVGRAAASAAVSNALGNTDSNFNVTTGNHFALSNTNAVTGPVVQESSVPTITNTHDGRLGRYIPAGTTRIVVRERVDRSYYDTVIAPALAGGGKLSSYFVLGLFKRIDIAGFEGINDRIPVHVYVQVLHQGEDGSALDWIMALP